MNTDSEETYSWLDDFKSEAEESLKRYTGSRPPVQVGAIINRRGQFQKYRVTDTTSGWRSIRISRIDDRNKNETISWDQFEQDYEERFF